MGKLGDHFPPDDRGRHVVSSLTAGRVLYLWCRFTRPPKEKLVVLACPADRPPLLLINSRIHPLKSRRPATASCQVPLLASEYSFLTHDSFVDCSDVIDELGMDEIETQLIADTGRIRDVLNADTIQVILDVLQDAKTVSPAHRRAMRAALSA
jgi:hypothetical protein